MARPGEDRELEVGESVRVPAAVLWGDPIGVSVPEPYWRPHLRERERLATRGGDDVAGHADRALPCALSHHRTEGVSDPWSGTNLRIRGAGVRLDGGPGNLGIEAACLGDRCECPIRV